jgi:hypothetical protein
MTYLLHPQEQWWTWVLPENIHFMHHCRHIVGQRLDWCNTYTWPWAVYVSEPKCQVYQHQRTNWFYSSTFLMIRFHSSTLKVKSDIYKYIITILIHAPIHISTVRATALMMQINALIRSGVGFTLKRDSYYEDCSWWPHAGFKKSRFDFRLFWTCPKMSGGYVNVPRYFKNYQEPPRLQSCVTLRQMLLWANLS